MTGAQAVQISDSDEPTPVYVPGSGDLGPLTQRVGTLETSDDSQDVRLTDLELATGDPAAVQQQIDESISAHVNAVAPHPVLVPHVHEQTTPAATWVINHGLGRYPQVTVVDTSGKRILPDLEYGSTTAVTLTHAVPLAGSAYLS